MISYKVIQKRNPQDKEGTQPKKFYAKIDQTGQVTLAQLAKQIEQRSTVSRADIQAVLISLTEVTKEALENGQIVRLGELGSVRLSIKSEGKYTEKEVTADTIKGAKIVFTPSVELKKITRDLKFSKK